MPDLVVYPAPVRFALQLNAIQSEALRKVCSVICDTNIHCFSSKKDLIHSHLFLRANAVALVSIFGLLKGCAVIIQSAVRLTKNCTIGDFLIRFPFSKSNHRSDSL